MRRFVIVSIFTIGILFVYGCSSKKQIPEENAMINEEAISLPIVSGENTNEQRKESNDDLKEKDVSMQGDIDTNENDQEKNDETLMIYLNQDAGFSFEYPKKWEGEIKINKDEDIILERMNEESRIFRSQEENGTTEIENTKNVNGRMVRTYLGRNPWGGCIDMTIKFITKNGDIYSINRCTEISIPHENIEKVFIDLESKNNEYQDNYKELYDEYKQFEVLTNSIQRDE